MVGDHRASSDLCATPDRCAGKQNRSHADVGIIFDNDRSEVYRRVQDGNCPAIQSVAACQDLHSGSDPDMAADLQTTARVHEALLPDPRPVADREVGIVVALEVCVVADVHARTNRHALGMPDANTILDMRASPEVAELGDGESATAMCGARLDRHTTESATTNRATGRGR